MSGFDVDAAARGFGAIRSEFLKGMHLHEEIGRTISSEGPVTDERTREAVEIVARHVVWNLVDNGLGEAWGLYPEIREEHWNRIAEMVKGLTGNPPREKYEAAYGLLSEPTQDGAA